MQTVAVFNAHRQYRVPSKHVSEYVLRVAGRKKVSISVIFVDGRFCKAINRKYLNHDYETDVLSFTLERAPVLEGEIYVNLDRAKKQAAEFRVSRANEIARLVIHGALHLIGFNDARMKDRKRMKEVEDKHVRYWFPHRKRNYS